MGRLDPVAAAMAPLQPTRRRVWGGEKWDPSRIPTISALYELGFSGTLQTTMRPSGSTAEEPDEGGCPCGYHQCRYSLVGPQGVGVVPSAVFGSVVVGVAPVVVEVGWWCCCDAAVRGAGDVVGEGAAGGAPGVGAAGDADGEGVVGDALVDGGVLTVPWGWDLATPGGGSCGCCWPVRWPSRCWRCLVCGPSLVSLIPIVLHALYGVVPRARALWVVLLPLLSFMLRVAVAKVALLVVLLLMPVARPLPALLQFMVLLVLLMLRALLVVGVGPCVGGQWLVFGRGLPLFPGGPWPVPLALKGRVRRTWCGLLVMPIVRVLQVMLWVMSSVRVV